MERDSLPEGWVTKKISAICEKPQYGYTESACHSNIGPKFLRITDIQDGKVEWDKVPYCKCANVDKYRLRTGDIVFARTGSVGKSFLIINPPEAVFASYLIRLRVGSSILPEFLYWYFQSSTYWASISRGIDDGNRPNMNGTKLANLEVPFPEDKAEQRRIVGRINELITRISEINSIHATLENDFREMLSGVYSEISRDAEYRPMSDIAPLVRRSVKVIPSDAYLETGIRCFGKGTFHKPALTGTQLGSKRIFRIEEDDLLFNIVFAWEGAVAVAKPEDHGRVGSHRFLTCVPKKGMATSQYLYFHFLTEQGLHDLGDASPGGAGRNRTLGLKALEKIKVPVPSYEKQVRFSKLWTNVNVAKKLGNEMSKELAAFMPSSLAKAFRGEL